MFSRLWFFQYIERCFEVETGVSRFPFIIKDIFGQSKPTEKYGKCMWQLNLFRKTTVPALCLSFLLHQEYLSYQWKYPAGEVGPSSAFVVIFGVFFLDFWCTSVRYVWIISDKEISTHQWGCCFQQGNAAVSSAASAFRRQLKTLENHHHNSRLGSTIAHQETPAPGVQTACTWDSRSDSVLSARTVRESLVGSVSSQASGYG